jgi:outer membrane protein assembly factor BamA
MFLRLISVTILLFILTFSAEGQKAHKPWLTIRPIREEPQAPLRREFRQDHTQDTNFLIITKINITGNRKTKTAIILRELRLNTGDTLYADNLTAFLEEKRQQLLNTSLFLTVHLYPSNTSGHRTELNIDVFERQYFLAIPTLSLADRNFNVWWVEENHRLNRLNYGLKIYQNNLTGKNDRLALTIQHGYTRQYALEYQLPYFDKDLKQGMGVFVSYSHNREINFSSDKNKQDYFKQDYFLKQEFFFGVNYTYKKAIRLKHKVSLTYHAYKVKDTVLKLNPDFFPDNHTTQKYLEFSYNFSYTGADVWAYPLRGFNVNAEIARRGLGLLGKVNETEISADADKFWTFFPKTYGDMEFIGAVHFPKQQPYFLQKEMGYYNNYLRGMEYFVLESDYFGILRNTVKREVLAFRVNTRLLPKQFSSIPIHIYLKTYGDLGYSSNSHPGSSILDNKWLYTYGVGADIVTFYDALLRVEYSINQLGQKGLFLHFKSTF